MPIVRILLVLLALASPLSMAGGAVAGPFEDAQAAHSRRDYATALRLWRPLADQGNAEAQYALGFMYDGGQGVPKNYARAAKWWRLAADQGHTFAQYNLGTLYDDGNGVPQNKAEAGSGITLPPSAVTMVRSSTSGSCISRAWPCPRTGSRLRSGFAALQTKVILERRYILASVTLRD